MDNFLKYFFQDLGRVFRAFVDILSAVFNFLNYLLNFPMRMKIIESYAPSFGTLEWVLLLIANLLLVLVAVLVCIGIVKLVRKIFRPPVSHKEYDALTKQVRNLQRDLIRANYEKDRLLAMKVVELSGEQAQAVAEELQSSDGQDGDGEPQQEQEEKLWSSSNRNTMESPCVFPQDSRFPRLTAVDNFYKTEYVPPKYNNTIRLDEFCDRFRDFAASRLGLYYEIDMIRYFIAALGTARIIILQGISGTGKTSLPYAFGKFIQQDASLVSVQPAWRERTELYGYFNEFTKRYSETDFLKAMYEANFYRDPHMVILDEMNIARVEYYFAEMLSILELPRKEEQKVSIVSATWDNDPCLIHDGQVQISDNLWFVGTINNDDSTFAVADKVYDRAIPIDLNSRAHVFESPDTEPVRISTDYMEQLFAQARQAYPLTDVVKGKLETLNEYLIKNFHLAFGNRVIKQISDYVPCYIACGGTEIQAVDFIIAKKVLRKIESLNFGFMTEELGKLSTYLDRLFGKNTMKNCKEYIEYLRKNG